MFVFCFSTSTTAVDPLIQKSNTIGYQSNKKLLRQNQNAKNHLKMNFTETDAFKNYKKKKSIILLKQHVFYFVTFGIMRSLWYQHPEIMV